MGGIAMGLTATQVIPHDPFIMIGASVIGALLPDICHPGSAVGRLVPWISKPTSIVFGHRTFTHSLLFLVLLSIVLSNKHMAFNVGLLIGVVSHYLLDMGTKNGIQLFYPLKRKIRFPLTIKTGGKMESVVKVGLVLTMLMTLFHAFTK